MLIYNNDLCRYKYSSSSKGLASTILTVGFVINAILGFIINLSLAFGIYKTRSMKKYTRYEKLVLVLSIVDIMVALVHIVIPIILINSYEEIVCFHLSMIGSWNILTIGISSSLILLVSMNRFIVVFNNNKCCGVVVNDAHVIRCLAGFVIANTAFALWYGFIGSSTNTFQQSILFFSAATYRLTILLVIMVINISMLVRSKVLLRNSEVQVQRNAVVEKEVSKTILMVSISLVVLHLPLVLSEYGFAIIMFKQKHFLSDAASIILHWAMAFCHLNSTLNSLTFMCKNKKISQMYKRYFRLLIERLRSE